MKQSELNRRKNKYKRLHHLFFAKWVKSKDRKYLKTSAYFNDLYHLYVIPKHAKVIVRSNTKYGWRFKYIIKEPCCYIKGDIK